MFYNKKSVQLVVLLLCCLFICVTASSQKKEFRIKQVKHECSKAGDRDSFLIPPNTKIGGEGLFHNRNVINYKKRFRYQRVIIKGLTTNYNNCLNQLNN